MSAVTVTGSSNTADANRVTSTQRRGNITSLNQQTGLTAVDTLGNVFKVPDYSIKEILTAIPKECYERVVWKSFFYVFRDIAAMLAIGFASHHFIPMLPFQALRFSAWCLTTWMLGLFGTGIWVMAHECGHQAFSDYGWLNDTVGFILHSYLMVPFFSWKYSHSKHHKATGHLTRDMVHVPMTKEQFLERKGAHSLSDLGEDSPIFTLVDLVKQQLFGWIAHLFINVTGQPYPDVPGWKHNHFVPTSPLFDKKDYWYILLSDVGIASMSFLLYKWYKTFGAFNFMVYWFVPWIFVNHWLVFITFLQHTDYTMPHYEASQWTFARGAAATIDREFGWVGTYCFHDIIETHVLHHYVSRIPFYNGRKGTEAIKKVMGEHYRHSDENMWVSLWKSGRACQFVDGENGVKMFRNINKVGVGAKA